MIPDNINELCCGMPYESKGMKDIATYKSQQLEEVLWKESKQGQYPVLMDTSPCIKRSIENLQRSINIFEPSQFVATHLLDKLKITPINEAVMLHVTCSSQRMGLSGSLLNLAKMCATEVIVPEHVYCCGWAGDKGFTTPELNSTAVSKLKEQVPEGCNKGFSNIRTCEIGLSHHSGIAYQSIMYLIDAASS